MALTVVEHIEHPFAKGNLTSDGIQWSAEKTTSTDGYETVEEVAVSPPALGLNHVSSVIWEVGLSGGTSGRLILSSTPSKLLPCGVHKAPVTVAR